MWHGDLSRMQGAPDPRPDRIPAETRKLILWQIEDVVVAGAVQKVDQWRGAVGEVVPNNLETNINTC